MDRGFEEGPILETRVDKNLPLHPRVLGVGQISPAGSLTAEPGEAEEPFDAGQGEVMVCRHINIVTSGLRGVNGFFGGRATYPEPFLPLFIHPLLTPTAAAVLDSHFRCDRLR